MSFILTKKYVGHEKEYPKYDNCNGINVNKTLDIPADYAGLMGVPITFLHKFNPSQLFLRTHGGETKKRLVKYD